MTNHLLLQNVLQYAVVCCCALQVAAVCGSVVQCVAVWCSVLQCVAVVVTNHLLPHRAAYGCTLIIEHGNIQATCIGLERDKYATLCTLAYIYRQIDI